MADERSYDLIVVGSGPGGYVASVRAAQLGMKVACVEKHSRVGGVCLNVGCIPSKALLDSSEFYHIAARRLAGHGIGTGGLSLDLAVLMARKDRVVEDLAESVRTLLEDAGAAVVHGVARLLGDGKVEVASGSSERTVLSGKFILLAAGSEPVAPPSIPFDGSRIVSSTEALSFDAVPERFGVVGGGAIGLELGSVWNRLGSRVTVLEMLPGIGATLDGQVSRTLERLLTKQGFSFRLKTRVVEANIRDAAVRVVVESDSGREDLLFDRMLVAVGRRPLTRGLGLEDLDIERDPPGTGPLRVDARYETSVRGVYAIGDLIAGPMLAHKASAEGIAAVECMAGLPGEVNYDVIASVIYTAPEAASVGLTEEQARERGIPCSIGSYPFAGVARARCAGDSDGFVKIIAHAKSGRILGIHIIGPRASEMIAEGVLAMELGATVKDIVRTVHAHPSFSEALHGAAAAVKN